MEERITYVGLDVHKEEIVAAVAEGGIDREVREYGRIGNTGDALDRLMCKLGGPASGFGFVTKGARAAMASNVTCRRAGTTALWCCVKKARERHAVREMKEDPSEPFCRGGLQTAMSCFGQKLR